MQISVGDTGSEITKFMTPLGAIAPLDPVRVAVNTSAPPSVGVELVVMVRVGRALETTVVVDEEVAPTAL